MQRIKVKAPAKINLTLEVLNKRQDGYHNIQSIMQAASLYDYLTIEIQQAEKPAVKLSGNSKEIPYDERNTAYKAAVKFFEKAGINNAELSVYIEKNIPVSAGLAGGSADAAGVIYALQKLYNNPLSAAEADEICAALGSDINFCLRGGCALCTSRGEITAPLPAYIQKISVIKPKNIAVSAKEAYEAFAALKDKTNPDNTNKLKELLMQGKFDKKFIYNSLEKPVLEKYPELKEIKYKAAGSIMSGSGSAFFVLSDRINADFDKTKYFIFENLETLKTGIEECKA